jgi:uncharacterized protein (DUF1499 family)
MAGDGLVVAGNALWPGFDHDVEIVLTQGMSVGVVRSDSHRTIRTWHGYSDMGNNSQRSAQASERPLFRP